MMPGGGMRMRTSRVAVAYAVARLKDVRIGLYLVTRGVSARGWL